MTNPPVSDDPPRLGGYITQLRARIAELEAEAVRFRAGAWDDYKRGRNDAIERCAQVVDNYEWKHSEVPMRGCSAIAAAIRALKDDPIKNMVAEAQRLELP